MINEQFTKFEPKVDAFKDKVIFITGATDGIGRSLAIEAAKLGCKIYHGPYTYNFKEYLAAEIRKD